ncbi:protein kinase, putative [Plasmodium vinckei vinckei]|uniref:CAMK protein kinase n=1 Tax=Plasmodium vinckei vinckei TaxID=54757 RepID=A0A081IBK4_PLAVN|nr:protein kinase, putative [Plasmodium vinckei vinckei]KEG01062.1 CAMK protein kinase [Plasmodium vinckei vinckei]VEV55006.1 protein kinase, putative [Plasmodium vinckei vinckei]
MQLQTRGHTFLKTELNKDTHASRNADNELVLNIQEIYKNKTENDNNRVMTQPYMAKLWNNLGSSGSNKMIDPQNACISLKLQINVKNTDPGRNKNYCIHFDINPSGIMSKNKQKIFYQYKPITEKNDDSFEKLPKEEKVKHFAKQTSQLAGKIIQHKQSKYKLLKVLQSAIYGTVYLSEIIEDTNKKLINTKKAIKVLSKHLIELAKEKIQEDPLSEYYYRDSMSGHSNVLICDSIFDDDIYIYMVMPFAMHGDLFEVMKNRNKAFSEEEARYLFYQILLAIKFLHSKEMALRDISLENVLLFENETNGLIYPVLNDPGQALHFNVNNKNDVVLEKYTKTFGKIFRPPEIHAKCKYDPTKIDVFCVGYILYFCLTKQELFRTSTEKDMYWKMIVHKKYRELLTDKNGIHLSNDAIDLIFHCLDPNFQTRYSINQVLSHMWFKRNMYPVHNFSLYLNNDKISEQNEKKPVFKFSIEIHQYAKKNNVKIDQNSIMEFFIYEHVYIKPGYRNSIQNKCNNTLLTSCGAFYPNTVPFVYGNKCVLPVNVIPMIQCNAVHPSNKNSTCLMPVHHTRNINAHSLSNDTGKFVMKMNQSFIAHTFQEKNIRNNMNNCEKAQLIIDSFRTKVSSINKRYGNNEKNLNNQYISTHRNDSRNICTRKTGLCRKYIIFDNQLKIGKKNFLHIKNNLIKPKELIKKYSNLSEKSKIKILNGHKRNIYRLIELKKKGNKNVSPLEKRRICSEKIKEGSNTIISSITNLSNRNRSVEDGNVTEEIFEKREHNEEDVLITPIVESMNKESEVVAKETEVKDKSSNENTITTIPQNNDNEIGLLKCDENVAPCSKQACSEPNETQCNNLLNMDKIITEDDNKDSIVGLRDDTHSEKVDNEKRDASLIVTENSYCYNIKMENSKSFTDSKNKAQNNDNSCNYVSNSISGRSSSNNLCSIRSSVNKNNCEDRRRFNSNIIEGRSFQNFDWVTFSCVENNSNNTAKKIYSNRIVSHTSVLENDDNLETGNGYNSDEYKYIKKIFENEEYINVNSLASFYEKNNSIKQTNKRDKRNKRNKEKVDAVVCDKNKKCFDGNIFSLIELSNPNRRKINNAENVRKNEMKSKNICNSTSGSKNNSSESLQIKVLNNNKKILNKVDITRMSEECINHILVRDNEKREYIEVEEEGIENYNTHKFMDQIHCKLETELEKEIKWEENNLKYESINNLDSSFPILANRNKKDVEKSNTSLKREVSMSIYQLENKEMVYINNEKNEDPEQRIVVNNLVDSEYKAKICIEQKAIAKVGDIFYSEDKKKKGMTKIDEVVKKNPQNISKMSGIKKINMNVEKEKSKNTNTEKDKSKNTKLAKYMFDNKMKKNKTVLVNNKIQAKVANQNMAITIDAIKGKNGQNKKDNEHEQKSKNNVGPIFNARNYSNKKGAGKNKTKGNYVPEKKTHKFKRHVSVEFDRKYVCIEKSNKYIGELEKDNNNEIYKSIGIKNSKKGNMKNEDQNNNASLITSFRKTIGAVLVNGKDGKHYNVLRKNKNVSADLQGEVLKNKQSGKTESNKTHELTNIKSTEDSCRNSRNFKNKKNSSKDKKVKCTSGEFEKIQITKQDNDIFKTDVETSNEMKKNHKLLVNKIKKNNQKNGLCKNSMPQKNTSSKYWDKDYRKNLKLKKPENLKKQIADNSSKTFAKIIFPKEEKQKEDANIFRANEHDKKIKAFSTSLQFDDKLGNKYESEKKNGNSNAQNVGNKKLKKKIFEKCVQERQANQNKGKQVYPFLKKQNGKNSQTSGENNKKCIDEKCNKSLSSLEERKLCIQYLNKNLKNKIKKMNKKNALNDGKADYRTGKSEKNEKNEKQSKDKKMVTIDETDKGNRNYRMGKRENKQGCIISNKHSNRNSKISRDYDIEDILRDKNCLNMNEVYENDDIGYYYSHFEQIFKNKNEEEIKRRKIEKERKNESLAHCNDIKELDKNKKKTSAVKFVDKQNGDPYRCISGGTESKYVDKNFLEFSKIIKMDEEENICKFIPKIRQGHNNNISCSASYLERFVRSYGAKYAGKNYKNNEDTIKYDYDSIYNLERRKKESKQWENENITSSYKKLNEETSIHLANNKRENTFTSNQNNNEQRNIFSLYSSKWKHFFERHNIRQRDEEREFESETGNEEITNEEVVNEEIAKELNNLVLGPNEEDRNVEEQISQIENDNLISVASQGSEIEEVRETSQSTNRNRSVKKCNSRTNETCLVGNTNEDIKVGTDGIYAESTLGDDLEIPIQNLRNIPNRSEILRSSFYEINDNVPRVRNRRNISRRYIYDGSDNYSKVLNDLININDDVSINGGASINDVGSFTDDPFNYETFNDQTNNNNNEDPSDKNTTIVDYTHEEDSVADDKRYYYNGVTIL